MTPTTRGEVDELLEPEESWPERTMLRAVVSEGMPGNRVCPVEDRRNRGAKTRQPRTAGTSSPARAHFTNTRTHDQHQHLDTAPLLQECRKALAASLHRQSSCVDGPPTRDVGTRGRGEST